MKIFLIRHGQTTGDVEDRYGGAYDDHLTDVGIEQSRELAKKLENMGIEKIFVSPLFRAQETAVIVRDALNCELEIVQDLRERNNYGILTGMRKTEAMSKHPNVVPKLKHHVHDIPNSESYDDFKKRILAKFEELVNKNLEVIAIVTHGGPISCIFRELLGHNKIKISDCGFVELQSDGGRTCKIIKMVGIAVRE